MINLHGYFWKNYSLCLKHCSKNHVNVVLSDQPLPSFCVCVWTGAVIAPRARLLPLRLGPAELPSGSCWLLHRALSAGQKPGHIWGDAHMPLIIPPHSLCRSQYVGLDVSWLCILKGHYSPVFRRVWVNSFMIMHVEWGRGFGDGLWLAFDCVTCRVIF